MPFWKGAWWNSLQILFYHTYFRYTYASFMHLLPHPSHMEIILINCCFLLFTCDWLKCIFSAITFSDNISLYKYSNIFFNSPVKSFIFHHISLDSISIVSISSSTFCLSNCFSIFLFIWTSVTLITSLSA